MSDNLEERLEYLEQEHKALSNRFKLYSEAFMGMLISNIEEGDIQALREAIEGKIVVARQSMQLDLLHDLKDLLQTLDAAVSNPGP